MCIWKLLFECIWKLIFWVHLENCILSAPGNYYFEFIWKLLYYFECIWKILFMCIWKILFWVLLETIILGASRNHTCYSMCIRKLLFWVHLETIILSASEKYFFSYIWKLLFYVHLETTCIWKQLFWVQLETSCICIWIYETRNIYSGCLLLIGCFVWACFWLAAGRRTSPSWWTGRSAAPATPDRSASHTNHCCQVSPRFPGQLREKFCKIPKNILHSHTGVLNLNFDIKSILTLKKLNNI